VLGTLYLWSWCAAALLIAWTRTGKDAGRNTGIFAFGQGYDSSVALVPGFLSPSDLELVVDHLVRLALHEEDSQSR